VSDTLLSNLKTREEWVCWTYEVRDGDKTKPPIQAEGGSRYAKTNDPGTWASYGEAVAYHEREDTDTEGVGLMLSDVGIVAGVDLGGRRNTKTGDLEPWAEDIIERLDTYFEVSPSGTGVRGFLLGSLPEGRNKQKQERTLDMPDWVVEEKNAEVELYDSVRYMTFTGEHIDGTPTEAQQRGDALASVHADYVQTDEDQADLEEASAVSDIDIDSSDSTSDEYTNEYGASLESIRGRDEKLDELLSRLEPSYTLPNDDDSASGYDLAAASKLWFWRFSEHDIASILRQYRNRSKMSRDDYVRPTIQNASGGEQYTPGGLDADEDVETTSAEAVAVLEEILDEEVPLVEDKEDYSADSDVKRRVEKLLPLVEDDDFTRLKSHIATVVGTSDAYASRLRDLSSTRWGSGPILSDHGRTYYLSGTPTRQLEILNFELDVESFLKIDGESMRASLRVENESTHFEKQVEPKVFNDRQRFEDTVLGEQFGLTFDPGEASAKSMLAELNKYIERTEAPVRRGTHHLGVHGDEFVTPAGSLTSDGWTDEPSTVYLERGVAIERRLSISPDTEGFNRDSVAEILRELPYTRDTSRFLLVLGWFYAAPFRPQIYDWEGAFNLLNVTGDTGSGKTTTLRYLWRCFGMQGEPFDARDTAFVLLSTFGASNSLPVWHDEYKPSDMAKYEVDRFHDMIRKTATGSVAQRGNADKSTTEYELAAPAVISGEQQIQPPAERRRSIMVQFRKAATEQGSETRRRFKQLIGSGHIEDGELVLAENSPDPSEHALAYYQFVTGLDDNEIRSVWLDAREYEYEVRQDWDGDYDLDDLEIQGLQTVVFGFEMYRRFAESMGVDEASLPDEHELRTALRNVADTVGPDGSRKSHLDTFVELVARARAAGYLEDGQHFTHVREGKPDEDLRVHLPRTYDAISKYVRDHDLDSEDLLDVAGYKGRFKEAAEEGGGYVSCYGQNSPPLSRCVGISTVAAMNDLDFDRRAFSSDVISDTQAQAPTEAATDGGAASDSDSSAVQDEDAGTDSGSSQPDPDLPAWERITRHVQGRSPSQNVLMRTLCEDVENPLEPEEFEHGFKKAKEEGYIQTLGDGWEATGKL
jgi:primase-polymerase (primpol)-like protein